MTHLTALVLAQSVPGSAADPTGGLLSYGVLGIVVVLLLSGLLVPGWLYKRSEAENDRLRKLIDEKVYPAVEASTRTQEKANDVMGDILTQAMQQKPPPRSRS